MSGLPPLPKIEGDVDLMLDVYTHSSLRFGSIAPMNDDYGDTERLAELGAKVLELTVTNQLYLQRPLLNSKEIQERRTTLISDANIDIWLKSYGLKEKLRLAPSEIHLLEKPEEMRKYFNSYLGALYIRNGLPTIQDWISRLIDPNAAPSQPAFPPASGYPASSRYGQQSYNQQNYGQQMGYSHPAPPTGPPPPLPSGPPPAMPPSSMSLVTLALVNQTAAQKSFTVTYPAEQVGPPHQPTWTVRCVLNGQERGRGIGKSQKIAKEEAARQAWAAMRWGPS
ncbi:ribonuclease III [Phlegmacium glaucopus]|nr:ribonuclease III [Phlegmacium glaucopus]